MGSVWWSLTGDSDHVISGGRDDRFITGDNSFRRIDALFRENTIGEGKNVRIFTHPFLSDLQQFLALNFIPAMNDEPAFFYALGSVSRLTRLKRNRRVEAH